MSRFSPTQHAYQPTEDDPLPMDPPLPVTSDPSTTAVALWLQVPSSRQLDPHTLTVAIWALQGEKTLVYATFQDSLPDFSLVQAWLRQYKPPSVYWALKNQGKHPNTQITTAVAERMESLSETLAATTESTSAAAAAAATHGADGAAPLHISITGVDSILFQDSHRTMPALLQNLVQGNSAAQYALKANVDLSTTGKATPLCAGLAVLWHGLALTDDTVTGYQIMPATRAPFLVLDRAATSSLNIWPVAHQGQAAAQGATTDKDSIYGLLSKPCETPGGKRLLQQWLQQPLTCLATLQQRQQAVAHLVNNSVERTSLKAAGLAIVKMDLGALATKLAQYAACTTDHDNETKESPFGSTRKALQTLYELYLAASQKIPALTEQVTQVAAVASDDQVLWKTWSAVLPTLRNELQRSVALVEAVLDLDQAPREFLVQASYQPDLQDLQQELTSVQAQVDEEHAAMQETWAAAAGLSSAQAQQVRLEFDEKESVWQFRLPQANDARILQEQLAGQVLVHRVLKNGAHFSTKTLRQLSDRRQTLLAQYDRLQRQVARDAVAVGATYAAVLGRLARVVAQMDAVTALAHVSAFYNYCRPELTDGDQDGLGIRLEQARHPCVELQENVEYIPNNVELVYGESSFLILTGPNMGGKSTYIRALGAAVLMAQIGCFVPATKACINICHHLLARVGAGDLPDRGISTFMAEMIEASGILQQASRRSLIMIDELGRGTSTWDGFGLARAIAEYIVDIGSFSVFATHFHELTALGDKPTVQNAHVTAQKGQHGLTFMYQVRPGPCLESFGIQVAEMANVPNIVVQDAKRKASELERFEYTHQSSEDDEAFLNRFVNCDLDAVLASPSAAANNLKSLLAVSPRAE